MQINSFIPRRLSAPFLVALLAGVLLVTMAQAAPGLSVSLVYFRGESQDNAARLEWRTATEDNTAGFKLERGASSEGPFTPLEELGTIVAQGNPSAGGTYEALDDTVSAGQTYWYRLVEVEYDNSEAAIDTAKVTISGPTPTAEPVTGGGGTGSTPAPPPTSTSAPTSTPEPTQADGGENNTAPTATQHDGGSAATPTADNTGQAPTATRRPTNTPPPPPTPMDFDDGGEGTEAAEVSAVAQVTPTESPDGYPGAATDEAENDGAELQVEPPTEESYPAPADSESEPQTEAPAYPPGVAGADGEQPVGGDEDATVAGDTAQEETESNVGRIVLWAGFAFALLVFAGGVIFAIVLSTRKRHDNLP